MSVSRELPPMSDEEFLEAAKLIFVLYEELAAAR
jgi:hypothetical protein